MPKNINSLPKQSSLGRGGSPGSAAFQGEHENGQQNGQEGRMYHENHNEDPHSKGSLASRVRINSKNNVVPSQSPQLASKKGKSQQSEIKHPGKMSRVPQEGLDLRENNNRNKPENKAYRQQIGPDLTNKNNSNHRNLQPSSLEDNLMAELDEPMTPEEEKIKYINANMEKLTQSLVDLRQNYSNLEKEEQLYQHLKNSSKLRSNLSQHLPSNHPALHLKHSRESSSINSKTPQQKANDNYGVLSKSKPAKPQTKDEILRFLLEKQRQKQERRRILQRQAEKQKQKLQEDKLARQKQEEQFLKMRQNVIRQASNFDQKHKKQKEMKEKGKVVLEEFKKKWKNKQLIHLKKQKDYQQKTEEEKKKLRDMVVAEKKEIFKPLNLAEIQEHQKWFLAKKAELNQLKKAEIEDQAQKINEKNAALPEHYHGKAHQIVTSELQSLKQKKKMPRVKAQKIKDYRQYVREYFSPKVKKSLSAQPDTPYDPERFMKIKRYRYYKGVSYGEIDETHPVAKNAQQIRRIGHGNMQYMKKIPKKRHQTPQHLINSYTAQPERKFDTDLVRRIFQDAVEKKKQKKAKVSIPQSLKVEELQMVLDQLKSNDLRIDLKQKSLNMNTRVEQHQNEQRKLNQSLVENIQRKLSLLSQL